MLGLVTLEIGPKKRSGRKDVAARPHAHSFLHDATLPSPSHSPVLELPRTHSSTTPSVHSRSTRRRGAMPWWGSAQPDPRGGPRGSGFGGRYPWQEGGSELDSKGWRKEMTGGPRADEGREREVAG